MAGGINNSSCFVIGKALAVTRVADSICCLVTNRGPVSLGASLSGWSRESPNPQPRRFQCWDFAGWVTVRGVSCSSSSCAPQNGAEGRRWTRYRRDSAQPGFIGAGAGLSSAGITESLISRRARRRWINYRLALFTSEIISFVPPPWALSHPGLPELLQSDSSPICKIKPDGRFVFPYGGKAGSEKPYYNANTGLA